MRPRAKRWSLAALMAIAMGACTLAAAEDAAAPPGLGQQQPQPPATTQVNTVTGASNAAPQIFQNANVDDLKNPEIMQPHDPFVKCHAGTAADRRQDAAAGALVELAGQCLPQHDAYTRAAEAASYLGYYYRWFSPYGSDISKRMENSAEWKKRQDSIRDCVSGKTACSAEQQEEVLKALVQYNFGKEIRAQVLENNTRAERMKSIDLPAQGWRDLGVPPSKLLYIANQPNPGSSEDALRTAENRGYKYWRNPNHRPTPGNQRLQSLERQPSSGSLRKATFRLDPTKVAIFDPKKMNPAELSALGSNFMRDYNQFVRDFSTTSGPKGLKSRWHYVAAKSHAVSGARSGSNLDVAEFNYGQQQDYENGRPPQDRALVDKTRRDLDARSQNNPQVREIVRSFEEQMQRSKLKVKDPKDPSKTIEVTPAQIALSRVGLGIPRAVDNQTGEDLSEEKTVQGIVINVNKAIYTKEQEMRQQNGTDRMPSGAGGTRPGIIPSVTMDITSFSKFLDEIWPPGIDRPSS